MQWSVLCCPAINGWSCVWLLLTWKTLGMIPVVTLASIWGPWSQLFTLSKNLNTGIFSDTISTRSFQLHMMVALLCSSLHLLSPKTKQKVRACHWSQMLYYSNNQVFCILITTNVEFPVTKLISVDRDKQEGYVMPRNFLSPDCPQLS